MPDVSSEHSCELDVLEDRISYSFDDRALLRRALTHRSFVNEQEDSQVEDNQRLEFLGDAILGAATAHELFSRYEDVDEGVLSARQSRVVREQALAEQAERLEVGEFIRLGHGEATSGGRHKKSLLADAFEALVAAVYLDGGYNAAYQMIRALFGDSIDGFEKDILPDDFKSRLQNRTQQQLGTQPTYRIIGQHGPPHDREFKAEVYVNRVPLGIGVGGSKQRAEQDAAKEGLEHFDERLDFTQSD